MREQSGLPFSSLQDPYRRTLASAGYLGETVTVLAYASEISIERSDVRPEANTACASQAHIPYNIFNSPLARNAMTMPSAGKYSFSSLADDRCPSMRKPSFNGRVSFALAALSRLS